MTDLTLPAPHDAFDLTMEDGAVIRIRRHGNPDSAVRIFLSHGNGFAIDGYLPFWQLLCPRYDVVVFDMRNHGRNPPAAEPNHDYAHMARDLARVHAGVAERLGARKSVGAFHSMSGRAAMKDAVETGWRWDALALFDPPDIPPPGHPLYDRMIRFEHRLADWAAARRQRYADPAELAAEYAEGRTHAGWVAGAHALMARAVLRRDEAAGDWVLVFSGALEAETYRANIPMNLWPAAADFGGPVLLLGADPDLERPSPTATANKAMAEEGGYDYAPIEGAGHMLQIERPEACLAAMDRFLAAHGLSG